MANAESTVNILTTIILGAAQIQIQKVTTENSLPAFSIEANGVHTVLAVLGEYALGVSDTVSELVFSCTGTASQSSFFSILNVRLYEARERGIVIIKSLETAEYMFQGALNGHKFYLKYWQSPFVYKWSKIEELRPDDNLDHVSAAARKGIKEYFRWSRLVQALENRLVKQAYREIKQWAQCVGLWSSIFGLLHDEYLAEAMASTRSTCDSQAAVNDLVLKFLDTISELPCPDVPNSVALEGNPNADKPGTRSSLRPQIAAYVKEEKERLKDIVIDIAWIEQTADYLTRFTHNHNKYLKITLPNADSLKLREAIINKLMDGLDRDSPRISYRLWPQRLFNDLEATDSSHPYDNQETFYLLGMDCFEQADVEKHLSNLTRRYEEYPSAIRIYIMEESDWTPLKIHVDPRRWDLIPSKDITELVVDDDEQDDDSGSLRIKKRKPNNKLSKNTENPPDTPSAPLRPALDVINRLRYDPQYNSSNYMIGYQDRFTNKVKEISMVNWKTDVTEKEFIPQHRIVYYKRSDGLTVWDREKRLDLVFGSGRSNRPE